jgi:predicted transcriptional regulator
MKYRVMAGQRGAHSIPGTVFSGFQRSGTLWDTDVDSKGVLDADRRYAMSAISVRLPDSLHRRLRQVAQRDNISINQMITLAVAEKLSALETEDYFKERAGRASRAKFQKALRKVKGKTPEAKDRI